MRGFRFEILPKPRHGGCSQAVDWPFRGPFAA